MTHLTFLPKLHAKGNALELGWLEPVSFEKTLVSGHQYTAFSPIRDKRSYFLSDLHAESPFSCRFPRFHAVFCHLTLLPLQNTGPRFSFPKTLVADRRSLFLSLT